MSDPDYTFITKEQLGEVLNAFTKDLEVMAENQRMLAGVLEEIDITLTAVVDTVIKRQLTDPREFDRLRNKIKKMKANLAPTPEMPPEAPPQEEPVEEHGGSAQGAYGPEEAFIFGGDGGQ